MPKMPISDIDTGDEIGTLEIPTEVIRAAEIVSQFLEKQDFGAALVIHGISLSEH